MAVSSDTVTILKSHQRDINTKRFGLKDGKPCKLDFKLSYLFDLEEYIVCSLTELSSLLTALEDNPNKFVIRGSLIEGRPTNNIRRTGKSDQYNHPESNFNPASRQWCGIDIDGLDLPTRFTDIANQQEEIIRYTISKLPEEFQDIDCHYQFSSSMGVTTGKIKVHLWYWLERKVSDAEMKAWLSKAETPVDSRLYQPVQPHFTARPIFTDGAIDPLPNRSGLFEAGNAKRTVCVPSDLQEMVIHPTQSQKASYVRADGTIEPQNIIRDPSSGLAIDGRETLMFELSLSVMKTWAKGNKKKEAPDLDELTQLLWQQFETEADLTDGKWHLHDAKTKMKARISDYKSGIYSFSSRADNTTLYPDIEPFFPIKTVDKQEGERQLNDSLSEFFNGIEQDKFPRLALRVTMGAGKTRQTIEHLKNHLKTSFATNVEIYVPRHEIANEYMERLNAGEPVQSRLIHVYGRGGRHEDNISPLCKRYGYVSQLEGAGVSIFQNACYDSQEEICEHFHGCEYINQFRIGDELEQMQNTIRIFQHASLMLPRNRLEQTPDIVIIDEAFLNECLKKEEISPELIRAEFNHPDFPKLGDLIVDCLREGKPLLAELKEMGIRSSSIAEINFDYLRPNIRFDSHSTHQRRVGSFSEYNHLNKIRQILLEEMRLDDRNDVTRILYNSHKKQIIVNYFNEPRIPETASLLVLDATADEVLLNKTIGDVDFRRIDIEQKAVVTQVYDRTGSKQSWDKGGRDVDTLISVLNEWSSFGEKVLCVSHQTLAEALLNSEKLSRAVKVNYFGNIRGSNDAEDCTVIFITGRNEPPPSEVDIKARGLFWNEGVALVIDDGSRINSDAYKNVRLPLSMRGYTFRDSSIKKGVGVYTFSDTRTDKLHQQICEAETIQAIARLRLVHTPMAKRVFLLSNLPVEMLIDNVTAYAELMPDKLEFELLLRGNLPLDPLGLFLWMPHAFENLKDAQNALSRSKFKRPSELTLDKFGQIFPTLRRATLCIVTFTATHNGRTREHRHLFMLPDQTLEHDMPVTTGSLPIDEWTQYLEHGDEQLAGSGWGSIEMRGIEYVPALPTHFAIGNI